jgi:hypothetical protein
MNKKDDDSECKEQEESEDRYETKYKGKGKSERKSDDKDRYDNDSDKDVNSDKLDSHNNDLLGSNRGMKGSRFKCDEFTLENKKYDKSSWFEKKSEGNSYDNDTEHYMSKDSSADYHKSKGKGKETEHYMSKDSSADYHKSKGKGKETEHYMSKDSSADYHKSKGKETVKGSSSDYYRNKGISPDYYIDKGKVKDIGTDYYRVNDKCKGSGKDYYKDKGSDADYYRGKGSGADYYKGKDSGIDYYRGKNSGTDYYSGKDSGTDYYRGKDSGKGYDMNKGKDKGKNKGKGKDSGLEVMWTSQKNDEVNRHWVSNKMKNFEFITNTDLQKLIYEALVMLEDNNRKLDRIENKEMGAENYDFVRWIYTFNQLFTDKTTQESINGQKIFNKKIKNTIDKIIRGDLDICINTYLNRTCTFGYYIDQVHDIRNLLVEMHNVM